MSVHRIIEFIGNGEGTKDIENSLNRLIDVINELGVKDRSHWALGLKGVKHEMKAHANEILNCAKSFAYYLDNYGYEENIALSKALEDVIDRALTIIENKEWENGK